jgi:hypothetical protein
MNIVGGENITAGSEFLGHGPFFFLRDRDQNSGLRPPRVAPSWMPTLHSAHQILHELRMYAHGVCAHNTSMCGTSM